MCTIVYDTKWGLEMSLTGAGQVIGSNFIFTKKGMQIMSSNFVLSENL